MYCHPSSLLGKCLLVVIGFLAALTLVAGQNISVSNSANSQPLAATSPASGFIQHIVIIMQENRTFDHYFGTYPGARGIPLNANGVPSLCVPDPLTGVCLRPYHSPNQINFGGPHTADASVADVNNGKMDGFVAQSEIGKQNCGNTITPECSGGALDVMSYHTDREIPNYWAYARKFVLQDNLYEPVSSYSLPAHLYMVSAWSAHCSNPDDPMTCGSNIGGPPTDSAGRYGWTDITHLLHTNGISWKYYIESGPEPDCEPEEMECAPGTQGGMQPGYWNPLPLFQDVQQNEQLGNIVPFDQFYIDARNGTLPAVSWIIPNITNSEHPANSIKAGQAYVTGLINAIMTSPNWGSTAIFLSWDDWGGFYDHLNPPQVDINGYGIRVPGLVISPYAKSGYIDHQYLSHDAYLKFIEDVFLNGSRLDPATDGRPDSRPNVRENAPILGNLMNDFDFTQAPRAPALLYQYYNYASFLYIANGGTNDISIFAVDSRSGRLSSVGSPISTGGANPAALAHDPQARFLFAANQDSNNVSAFRVNQTTGALTAVTGSPFVSGNRPTALLVDTTGGYLFNINSGTNELWTYSVHPATGALTKISVTPLAATSPTQLVMDNSGRFLYVADSGSERIYGFIFDNSNGKLMSMSGSPYLTGASGGPFGVTLDYGNRWVFSSDESSNTVSQFAIGYAAGNPGALTPAGPSIAAGLNPGVILVSKVSTIPYGWNFLFALNRSSKNLSAYTFTDTSPMPAPMTNSPFTVGENPTAMCVDQLGGYLYVTSAGRIWAFRVAQSSLPALTGSPFSGPSAPQAIDVIATAPIAQYATTTTITLSSGVNPSEYGQPVTFTAKINSETGAIPRDGEIVTFKRGDTPLGTAVLHSGSAQLTTSALGATTTQIRATYAGDAHLPAGTSLALAQVVNKAQTTTALISSLNPSVYGQSITLTATITARFGGIPSGSVAFREGTNTLGTVYGSGKFTLVTSRLTSGSHSITTTYNGNSLYLSSTSSAISQTVGLAVTTTTLIANLTTSSYGQSVRLTVTVKSGTAVASGTVTVKNGTNIVGAGVLNSSGVFILSIANLPVGTNSLTAIYAGNANFKPSTSTTSVLTVNRAATTTMLQSSLNPSTHGTTITFTATVKPSYSGAPSGTVTFKDGPNVLAGTTVSGGVAKCTTSTLGAGIHTITASYSGDQHFTSSSRLLTQTVN
jgi:phospholipase C/DNA-binding beta-propeller fold protein YncE